MTLNESSEDALPREANWPRKATDVPVHTRPLVAARWEFLQLSRTLGRDIGTYGNVLDQLRSLGWEVTYRDPGAP
jgi:hypothetical protein